jgi:hypothetical protein
MSHRGLDSSPPDRMCRRRLPGHRLRVAVAMALVLLVPFGKFTHVIYRPLALLTIRLRG